jgi:hypothetical protein
VSGTERIGQPEKRTGRIRQAEQAKHKWIDRIGQGGTEQAEKDRQNNSGRMRKAKLDRQNWSGRTRLAE